MNILKKIYCRAYQACFKIAIPVLPYKTPTILKKVDEIIDVLKNKNINSVFLVTDANLRKLSLTENLENLLLQNNISLAIYDKVLPNPTVSNVEDALKIYNNSNAQAIIAFGGGSPIDCAKAVGARVARPNKSLKQLSGVLKVLKKIPLLFAIPTTSGTGSEATLAAVITDDISKQKYAINDFPLIPKYAVLDYRLTLGLPPHITSTTGLDALVHIVESYIGNFNTKFTISQAEQALLLLEKHLYTAYTDPSNIQARSAMQESAYMAGVAFSRAAVGYVHAISHSISGRYGVAHGLANAIIMPYVLKEYGSKIDSKLAKLAKLIKLADDDCSDDIASKKFYDWVLEQNSKMNIPNKIKEIKREDIDILAKYADAEANPLYPVPVLMNVDKLKTIIEKLLV